MKIRCLMIVLIVFALAASACANKPQPASVKTPIDKASYALGVEVAKNLKTQGIEINKDLMIKGITDVLSGEKLLFTDQELRKTMEDFQADIRRKTVQAARMSAFDNKQAGDAFMTQNKTKEGVVTLPDGLQYKILKEGTGRKPTENDSVECNYKGTLVDGTEFDSSYKTGKPATFAVKSVIPGWREALKLMPEGSKWQLVIPPELAYGQRGAGKEIGPNATLVFELDLLTVK